jgi:hypothetical protein
MSKPQRNALGVGMRMDFKFYVFLILLVIRRVVSLDEPDSNEGNRSRPDVHSIPPLVEEDPVIFNLTFSNITVNVSTIDFPVTFNAEEVRSMSMNASAKEMLFPLHFFSDNMGYNVSLLANHQPITVSVKSEKDLGMGLKMDAHTMPFDLDINSDDIEFHIALHNVKVPEYAWLILSILTLVVLVMMGMLVCMNRKVRLLEEKIQGSVLLEKGAQGLSIQSDAERIPLLGEESLQHVYCVQCGRFHSMPKFCISCRKKLHWDCKSDSVDTRESFSCQ